MDVKFDISEYEKTRMGDVSFVGNVCDINKTQRMDVYYIFTLHHVA